MSFFLTRFFWLIVYRGFFSLPGDSDSQIVTCRPPPARSIRRSLGAKPFLLMNANPFSVCRSSIDPFRHSS